MEGEEILNPGTPTTDVVYSYPGGGTTIEAHDDGVVLLVLGPGAPPSASTDGPTTYPDLASPTTRSDVPYTDWTTTAHPGSAPAPATRTSVPSTGAVIGESYTDMLMAHLSSGMYPATRNNDDVAYPGSVTTSPAINGGVAMAPGAYPGGLNLNDATARPDTNAVVFGYTTDVYLGMADLGSERLHPAGSSTAAAAAGAEPGGGYYHNNSGMALPFTAAVVDESDQDDQAAGGAVAEPVRGGLGGLGLAATSLAMAGLIAGGVDTPVTAVALYGMLLAGVIMVTVRVFRA